MTETASSTDQRAALYAWFATLYARELSTQQLQAWLDGAAEPLLSTLEEAGFATEIQDMRRALDSLRVSSAAQLDLAADFTSSFLLDLHSCAAPYASCYQGDSPQLFGPAEKAMRHQLNALGLGVDSQFAEAADHLALQLELLSWLATARRESEEATHIASMLQWLPRFVSKAQHTPAQLPFYPALSRLLLQVLQELAAEELPHADV